VALSTAWRGRRASSTPEVPLPGTTYRQIGVKLWGEGAYEREVMDGSQTKYGQLYRADADDIIVNKIWARNGSVAVVPSSLAGCYGSGEFPMFTPNRERLDPRWIHWLTKTRGFWSQCDQKSQGTSGKNRIRPERFLDIEIALPPLPEQRRVVGRIEELAVQVQEARGLRQEASEQAAFLVPSGLSAIFQHLGNEHRSKRLDELCEVVRGGSPRPAGSPTYYGGTIPFIKVGDLTKDDGKYVYQASTSVNELGRQHSRYIEANTLMLTNSGATLGVPKITKFAGCFNDGSQAFLNLHSQVDQEFLYYFFKSKLVWFREQLARGQGQPNLNTAMTKQMEVPLPPLDQQRRIVNELDDLQREVDSLKQIRVQAAVELDALLPAILDRAFKGELV